MRDRTLLPCVKIPYHRLLGYRKSDLEIACNRLDRLTSGLMFLAKNADAARSMTEQLRIRTVRKQYVARVRGEFPE